MRFSLRNWEVWASKFSGLGCGNFQPSRNPTVWAAYYGSLCGYSCSIQRSKLRISLMISILGALGCAIGGLSCVFPSENALIEV